MLQMGLQIIVAGICFAEMMGSGIAPLWSVGSLMIHLILYLSTGLFVDDHYKPLMVTLDGLVIAFIILSIHPSGILLMALFVALYWQENNCRGILLLGVLVIGYAYLVGNEGLGIRHYTPEDYITEGGMFPIGLLVVMTVVTYHRLQSKLEAMKALQVATRLELLETKRKVEMLTKHQGETTYMAQMTERNMMAQRLHDKIGHTLAGNIMRLEVVKLMLEKDPPRAGLVLDEIIDHLREGMDDIRRTLRELKPEQSEVGLHTVKALLGGFEVQRGVRSTLYFEGDLKAISVLQWQVIVDNLK
ncbi:MAG: sensor histidine kinase, partial [Cellulosilyticaceae bacterium]